MAKKKSMQLAEELLHINENIASKKIDKAQYDKSYNATILGINQDFTDDVTEEEQQALIKKYSIKEVPDKDNYYTFKINGNYYVKSSNTSFKLYENVKIRVPNGNWDNMYIEVQRDTVNEATGGGAKWITSVEEPTTDDYELNEGDYWVVIDDEELRNIIEVRKYSKDELDNLNWSVLDYYSGAARRASKDNNRNNIVLGVNEIYKHLFNNEIGGEHNVVMGDSNILFTYVGSGTVFNQVDNFQLLIDDITVYQAGGLPFRFKEGDKYYINVFVERYQAMGENDTTRFPGECMRDRWIRKYIGGTSFIYKNGLTSVTCHIDSSKFNMYDYLYAIDADGTDLINYYYKIEIYKEYVEDFSETSGRTWQNKYNIVAGRGNIISGAYGFTLGYNNHVSGSAALVIGDRNCIEKGAFFGNDNSGSGLILGNSNTGAGLIVGDCNYGARTDGIMCGTYLTRCTMDNSAEGSPYAVFGTYNLPTETAVLQIGVGHASYRMNALSVNRDGSFTSLSEYLSNGADYAEYYEWQDKNINKEDRRGLFVTIKGNQILLANDSDNYVLGVISAAPTIIGNASQEQWHDKFKKDIFGAYIRDEEDKLIISEKYDASQKYIPRSQRPEYSPVGTHGQLIVIDDGTCEVNGYCGVGENGIGTKCDDMDKVYKGLAFRVTERLDETHIRIIIK